MKRSKLLIFGVAALSIVSLAGWKLQHSLGTHPVNAKSDSAETAEPRELVELSPEKRDSVQLEFAVPEKRMMQPFRQVPGRIEYNAARHIELKSPFDGLIRRIDVKIGDRVEEGQILGIVESPELGERRADVLQRESSFQQAKNEHDWWHSIQANVDELIERMKPAGDVNSLSEEQLTQLEEAFSEKPLGDFRQQIFAAYSRMRLDERLSANVKPAAASGASPLRVKLELDSARDSSRARFIAVCEQATFDVKQTHFKAESAMNDAEQRLEVAKQRLEMLNATSRDDVPATNDKASLSTWPVKAPFSGTVEDVMLAPRERIQLGQGLFQLADASQLWVRADIRERDWSALNVRQGQKVKVQTPALPGQTLEAEVFFVGRVVTAESRAVPLTAVINNSSGSLRPGMFVRVLIPDGSPGECLTVPQEAVISNEGQSFVFVEIQPGTFQRRFVSTGLSIDPWIEIKSGLIGNEQIVTKGNTLLKAELLLEPDE